MNIQDWTLYYDNLGPLSCQAPCTMYSVLYDHGKIPDPFYGTNERELQYLAEKDCVFESVFSAPPALFTREHIELVFHGLDTICHIYLNGTLLGKVKNMHREYVYEVKPLLTAGENTLRLEFKSPRRYFAQQQHKHYLYMNDGDTLPGAAHLRKAMYQSGWDWGPTLPDMGIFRGVELKGWNVDRFDGVAVRQHHENGSVSVELDVTTKCHAGCEIYADFDGKRVLLKNGHGIIKVDNPKLWWARGYGDQPLYDLDVELVCGGEVIDRCHKQLGLRTLTVSTEPDADGKGSEFCFVLNGVKIFSMGANLVPMDNLLSRITDQRWETIVRQAVDANFNTLRVWGGGYYPDSRFYELCDQYGLLVWQDFMVACANIYLTSEMAGEFTQEAICNLKRLHHHASLALLCGNNEMESGVINWGSRDNQLVRDDYTRLYGHLLPELCETYAPDTYYWPSSPSSGGGFDDPDNPAKGDTHYWEVWHGGVPFTTYRQKRFRFCSEYGFESFPSMKTIRTFAREEDLNCFSRHGEPSEVPGRQREDPAVSGGQLPVSCRFRESGVRVPAAAGGRHQIRRGTLPPSAGVLHGLYLLAVQRLLAGGLLVQRGLLRALQSTALRRPEVLRPRGHGPVSGKRGAHRQHCQRDPRRFPRPHSSGHVPGGSDRAGRASPGCGGGSTVLPRCADLPRGQPRPLRHLPVCRPVR